MSVTFLPQHIVEIYLRLQVEFVEGGRMYCFYLLVGQEPRFVEVCLVSKELVGCWKEFDCRKDWETLPTLLWNLLRIWPTRRR